MIFYKDAYNKNTVNRKALIKMKRTLSRHTKYKQWVMAVDL